MSFPKDDHELDEALTGAYSPPLADFEAWRNRHAEALACLDPARIAALTTRRIAMKRAVQVFVGAIVAAAAVLGFVLLWGGVVVGPASAMEKALENVRKARSYKCVEIDRTTYDEPNPGGPAGWEATMVVYWLAPGSERWDTRHVAFGAKRAPRATTEIRPAGRPALSIDHHDKTYRWAPGIEQKHADGWDLASLGKWFSDNATRDLGIKETGGKKARGFQIDGKRMKPEPADFERAEIWIDPESNLPVLVRYEGSRMLESTSTTEIRDIQWNVEVDPKLFDTMPPKGYANVTPKPPTLKETVRQITGMLSTYAEASRGRYPKNIDVIATYEELCKMLGLAHLPSCDETEGIAGKAVKTLAGFDRVAGLHMYNPDYAYYGKAVGPKDKAKVLMHWKLDDGRYEVIFGDLHAETVAAERLHALEGK